VAWGGELAAQCAVEATRSKGRRCPKRCDDFEGLVQVLLSLKLRKREALELMPLLLRAAIIMSWRHSVLPYGVVYACIFQLSKEWLTGELEQFSLWKYTYVEETLVVATAAVVETLETEDPSVILGLGSAILNGLEQAGVDLDIWEIDTDDVESRFLEEVEELSEEGLTPEKYLDKLLVLISEFASEACDDEDLMEEVERELEIALSFFLRVKTLADFDGESSPSDALLGLAKTLFVDWGYWPGYVIDFLIRYPPSVDEEIWMSWAGVPDSEESEVTSSESPEAQTAVEESDLLRALRDGSLLDALRKGEGEGDPSL